MGLALDQARAAAEAGEVPVGAVVFAGDTLLSSGQNCVLRHNDPTAHAEVVAMREAGRLLGNYRLLGCTLYCTLEPCAMVYGAGDKKAGAAGMEGSPLAVLNHPQLNHRIALVSGVMAEQCGEVLRAFFQARRI
jgi:tRNA(adenine34) deaminase